MKKIEKMIQWALKIANDNSHGYSQVNREGNPDYDCSSFISDALRNVGFQVTAFYTTRELYNVLCTLGWTEIPDGEPLKAGDIVLNPGHHVALMTAPDRMVHARSDENGGITGKMPGDQTGHEIEESTFYTPTGGWKYRMRYEEPTADYTDFQYEVAALYVLAGIWGSDDIDIIQMDPYRVLEETKAIRASKLVLRGIYGNMPERKENLEREGFDYNKVQKYVNRRLAIQPNW